MGVIEKVVVKVRTPKAKSTIEISATKESIQSDGEKRWIAKIPSKYIPTALQSIQLSAVLLTRNGVILSMGEQTAILLSSKQTSVRQERQVSAITDELQIDTPFVGGIGIVGLMGTTSRLRLLVGASGIDDDWGAGLSVTVGPNFAQPDAIATESQWPSALKQWDAELFVLFQY